MKVLIGILNICPPFKRENMKKNGQKSWGTSIHLLSKYLWKTCQAKL